MKFVKLPDLKLDCIINYISMFFLCFFFNYVDNITNNITIIAPITIRLIIRKTTPMKLSIIIASDFSCNKTIISRSHLILDNTSNNNKRYNKNAFALRNRQTRLRGADYVDLAAERDSGLLADEPAPSAIKPRSADRYTARMGWRCIRKKRPQQQALP